jgi:hypothetical protein
VTVCFRKRLRDSVDLCFFLDVADEILGGRHTIEEAMSAFHNFPTITILLKDSRPSPCQKLPNMPNTLVPSSQIPQFHILNTYISTREDVWGNTTSATSLAANINKHLAQV